MNNKDLNKFGRDMAIQGLMAVAPVLIKGLSEFIKDGGAYDLIEAVKKATK